MTKEVFITISGLQFAEHDQSDPIEIISKGEYYTRNGKHFVLYDEIMEGFEGVTKNVIKMSQDCVEITKKGVSNVHMVFEKNKKTQTCYHTPFGSIMLGIYAKKIELIQEEERIDAIIEYMLDLNYEHLADCHIEIRIVSKKTGDFLTLH